jgi:hypothetical protein
LLGVDSTTRLRPFSFIEKVLTDHLKERGYLSGKPAGKRK